MSGINVIGELAMAAMMAESAKPIKETKHYEVEFSTEEEAKDARYQVEDGWSPFINVEAEGKVLYFRNDTMMKAVNDAFKANPKQPDYAKIVATDWFKDRAKLVTP
jgi:hypothetical protein